MMNCPHGAELKETGHERNKAYVRKSRIKAVVSALQQSGAPGITVSRSIRSAMVTSPITSNQVSRRTS